MKKLLAACMATGLAVALLGNTPTGHVDRKDTVIIQLDNGSRVVIYTKNKQELSRLKSYDFNKMIQDLNEAVEENEIDYYEIIAGTDSKYILNDDRQTRQRIIIDNGDTTIVGVEETSGRKKFTFSISTGEDEEATDGDNREMPKIGSRSHFLLDLGINNWLEDGELPNESNAPYSVKNWGSWYLGLNWMNNTQLAGPFYLDWGAGVSWYNWKLENANVQVIKGMDQIQFVEDTAALGRKSKLTASYFNFFFVPMIDFSRKSNRVMNSRRGDFFKSYSNSGVRVGMGVYAGLRINSKSKFVIDENGERDKNKENASLFLENFRYGIRGQVGYQGIDLFIMYDLNEVFVEDRGPNGIALNAVTVGVSF